MRPVDDQHVEVQHPRELGGVLQVVRAHAAAAAGVGDEAVEATEGLDVAGHEGGDVVLDGDVGDLGADRAGGTAPGLDASATLGEAGSAAPADADGSCGRWRGGWRRRRRCRCHRR